MGAQSEWVLRATGSVSAEPDHVVSWFHHPDRTRERLEKLRGIYGDDLSVIESSSDGVRVLEMTWSNPTFGNGYSRRETPLEPVVRTRDRYLVRSTSVTRTNRGGKETTTRCEAVTEFALITPGVTSITATHRHIRTGGHWEEKWLPPVKERLEFRRSLQRSIAQYRTANDSPDVNQAEEDRPNFTQSVFRPRSGNVRRAAFGLTIVIVLIVATVLGLAHKGPTSFPADVSSITTAAVDGTAQSIVMAPNGHYAYVLTGDKYVDVLNLDSAKLVDRVLLGETGEGIAIAPDGKRVYVVADADKSVGLAVRPVTVVLYSR